MEKYINQSSSLVRLRCYKFGVSGFNPATCFAWYSRWGLLFNFTFNLRCCCSTPRVLFNSVATVLLPVFYHEEKQVFHFFLWYSRVAFIFSDSVIHRCHLLTKFQRSHGRQGQPKMANKKRIFKQAVVHQLITTTWLDPQKMNCANLITWVSTNRRGPTSNNLL